MPAATTSDRRGLTCLPCLPRRDLSNNGLLGTVPQAWTKMSQLKYLWVAHQLVHVHNVCVAELVVI